ncbi:MAG: hypothetical protein BAA04_02200 [Firmicutes bacterium ZCTH02-B6]|nr:MAG: hypothetical protein BAA04_02200 [Firmicutes bacterium ZCTH02-B6]
MVNLLLSIGFAVLLGSNIWLLRELDRLRREMEAYQREVTALDNRVVQLMYAVEEAARPEPQES